MIMRHHLPCYKGCRNSSLPS
uniref:Uncharacterized protein n=1 Tax=Arundo donax TaxID=35708 RepID=A0A0A8Z695_ARUDO